MRITFALLQTAALTFTSEGEQFWRRVLDETAEWRKLNPYWAARAYVEVKRGVAYCRYASDQGTTTFAIVR